MAKALNQILKAVFIMFLLALPSFVLNSFVNTFDFPKTILIVALTAIILVLTGIQLASAGKLTFRVSPADLPLLALVLIYIISAILKTPNKMEAFMSPGTVTIVISGFLLYFFAKMIFKTDRETFILGLFFSGVLASLLSIFAYTGILTKIPQLPAFVKDTLFSPLGGKLPEIIFLATVLPLGGTLILKERDIIKKIFYIVASLVILLNIILAIGMVLPGKAGAPILADYQTSWSVAVDTLKISPIWGIGPANYLTAFSKFLPISYNSTPLWAVRFSSAGSFILTLLTETGILGFLAFAVSIFILFKKSVKNPKAVLKDTLEAGSVVSLLILIIGLIVFPANSVLIVLLFLLAYPVSEGADMVFNLSATGVKNGNYFSSKIPSLILALIILAGVFALGFFARKVILAEREFKLAIDAIAANDGKTSYNDLGLAINENPYVDRYHATFDQLSLALAGGLAKKQNPTDSDKNTVAQLIQQAISEGKSTVALNPLRSGNWELLARTYQAIIPFAQGADQFTIQTYTQAIALDPINPNLRISLGGVYYALGRYDDAIGAFTLAASAKPDLANAHYNLAIAYRDKKDFGKAIAEMNTVLSLVAKDSADYALAQKTLTDMEKAKPATPTTGTTNLVPPAPLGTTGITPQITLPKEATPPAQP